LLAAISPSVKLSLKAKIGVFFLELLLFPLARLPRRLWLWAGRLLGLTLAKFWPRRRIIAENNIARAQQAGFLPPTLNARATARKVFQNVCASFMEVIYLHMRGFAAFQGLWDLRGRENLEEAYRLARERHAGTILLTAHVGAWELAPHILLAEFGIPIVTVGRTQGSAVLDSLLIQTRTEGGNGFIFKDRGVREMLKVLHSGGVIGTLFDQAAMVEREAAPLAFMGRTAHTNLGPVKLAAKTRSPLVPLFGRRDRARLILEIFPSLPPPLAPDPEWIPQAAQELNDILGAFVQKYPEEWLWLHRRWKTPEGLKNDPRSF
jgi:KDO2-lipid IV(A) lauroyltransferase